MHHARMAPSHDVCEAGKFVSFAMNCDPWNNAPLNEQRID